MKETAVTALASSVTYFGSTAYDIDDLSIVLPMSGLWPNYIARLGIKIKS